MKRRMFLTSLFAAPAVKAAELSFEELEVVLRGLPWEEVKSLQLGSMLHARLKGIPHKGIVVRIDQWGDRAAVYLKCEY